MFNLVSDIHSEIFKIWIIFDFASKVPDQIWLKKNLS